jgi:ABC-type Mn2+/Zn2+ transport system permease subunit
MMYAVLSDLMIAFLCAACLCGLASGCWLVWKGIDVLLPRNWGK